MHAYDPLVAVRDAARSVVDRPGVHRFGDFLIHQGPCRSAYGGMMLRSRMYAARNRVAALLTR